MQGQNGTLKGKVVDPDNKPISSATVSVLNTNFKTQSDIEGNYSLSLPGGKTYWVQFTHATHQTEVLEIEIKTGFTYDQKIKLVEITLGETVITDRRNPTDLNDPLQMQLLPIKTEDLIKMPSFNRSIEASMRSMPGVASNSEFSSQYRVRGGNFDENLVYVNGIEIYRPLLARSGQQEGLGFSNPDMAEEVLFSTGGFAAQYGDKLSSVLDITYRNPKDFRATIEAGLITTNLHVEGRLGKQRVNNQPKKWSYLIGARRYTLSNLLNTLETQGNYQPLFYDAQGLFTFTPVYRKKAPIVKEKETGLRDTVYFPNEPLKFSLFTAFTRNRYLFDPESRVSTFGTIQQAFRIRTGFAGQELSAYTTGLAALMLEHFPSVRLKFNYTATVFQTSESELIDVEGGYLIGEVNTSFGSDEFNEELYNQQVASELQFARNYLNARVASAQISGRWIDRDTYKQRLNFGLQYQRQWITDDFKEYIGVDSAGYLIDQLGNFGVNEYIRLDTTISSTFYKGFVQHEWRLGQTLTLVSGVRLIYYDLLDEWMLSPRVQFVKDFSRKKGGRDLRLRLASGIYYQPPFYRELRRFDGSLNTKLSSQRSAHFIAGMDYQFQAWGRPFKLISELYYKSLTNIIPYEIQNIRIRYYPDELAKGYAYGLDARLNGEFLRGVDSWVSLGILKTQEDLEGDDKGYIPRPTDQRVSFSMYFQDELPINPTYKVHVNYVFGSGLRFGPPRSLETRTSFTNPTYQRVDIGFSKLITFIPRSSGLNKRGVESLWLTAEIFNLLQRQNTVSHTWIKDLDNRQYAVPNYLSARLLNVRLIMKIK